MMNSGSGGNMDVNSSPAPGAEQVVVSALFRDARSARAAIQELRDVKVPPGNISLITRNEDEQHEPGLGLAGVSHEEIRDEGRTYRASYELPNDEDLPTTEADLTGRDVPVVTDFEVPPDEPLGGSDRLGLERDTGLIRRNEAQVNADEDIYTDFPDEPGGFNPDSPAIERAGADIQEPRQNRTDAGGSAAVGAGIGGLAGLVVGAAALAIPGIGPIIAAGPLAGALGSLVAGSATGGIIGALSTIGVPEEYAREYAARIEEGQSLVSVRTNAASSDLVARVLTYFGGESVH